MTPAAQERIAAIVRAADTYRDNPTITGLHALTKVIETALREQDRDTRHACAEAVTALDYDILAASPDTIAACMNARAV